MIDQSKFVELPPEAVTIICELQQQLAESQAESQAREAVLREALERLACLGNGDRHGNSIGNDIAIAALTLPTDNTALLAAVRAGKLEVLNWVKDAAYTCGDTVTVRESKNWRPSNDKQKRT